MRNIFSHFDRSQKPIQEAKDRIPMALIQKEKSCLIAASCPYKQKFVCDPIWQTSTRSYQYYRQTAKRYAVPPSFFLVPRPEAIKYRTQPRIILPFSFH